MDVNTKFLWIVFIIILIVNLTPAFATELSEIGNEAKSYNEESKKEMGFFAKAKFMAKGYQLVNKAEESSSQTENKEETLEDKYEALANKTNNNTQNKIIGKMYRDRNNIQFNETNTTKDEFLAVIQQSLKDDANYIINALNNQNMSTTLTNHPNTDTNLNNNIVQIVTEGGYIHYVLIKNIDLKNNKVTYTKNGKTDSIMSLDEFKKSYTGIILTINNPNTKPLQILAQIKKQHTNDLNTIQETAQNINNKTKTAMIYNGIAIAISIIIMIIGCLLATWFSKPATSTLKELDLFENARASKNLKAGDQFICNYDNSKITFVKRIYQDGHLRYIFNDPTRPLGYVTYGKYEFHNNHLIPLAADIAAPALVAPAGAGCVSTGEAVVEIVATTGSQNYLATIMKVIGIFLIIGGLIGLIISTYLLIYNGLMWYQTGRILKGGIADSKKLEDWYTTINATKNKTLTNSTINLNTTPTIQT